MSGTGIIVVGHAALDYVYKIAAFPPTPTKIRALQHIASGGGMAANASAAIARLGGDVALWSRLGGDDAGTIIRRQLQAADVNTTAVRVFPGVRSPTAAVIVDSRGERLIVSEDDHVMPKSADWLPLSHIRGARAVFSDLTWLEGTEAAFAAARAQAIPTVLDVDLGSGQLLSRVLGLTDYAIFSAPALRAFVEGKSDEDRLRRLIKEGVRHAGVTLGAKGYRWTTSDGRLGEQSAFPVETVDTTGAGDAFHGAFVWSLANGMDDAKCARIASAAAALSCRALGARAAQPTLAELDAFLKNR